MARNEIMKIGLVLKATSIMNGKWELVISLCLMVMNNKYFPLFTLGHCFINQIALLNIIQNHSIT
jgi:hypothetical protein